MMAAHTVLERQQAIEIDIAHVHAIMREAMWAEDELSMREWHRCATPQLRARARQWRKRANTAIQQVQAKWLKEESR